MTPLFRRISHSFLTVLLGIIVIELCAALLFTVFKEKFTFFTPDQYYAKEKLLDVLAWHYDRDLGWDTHYATENGERPRPAKYGRLLIATFGDSYTNCAEVADHETWQTYLSELLQCDVLNYGVGAYGTDQAYLKFLQVYPSVETRFVILGLITENINRVVNVYRPFYTNKTDFALTKPRFDLVNGELTVLKNPIQHREDVRKLREAKTLAQVGKRDWWFNKDDYPIYGFPFTRILLNRRVWLEAFIGQAAWRQDRTNPRPWEDLWSDDEARSLMFAIFERFVHDARAFGAIPIILVLPQKVEVLHRFYSGHDTHAVKTIIRFCDERSYYCFNAVSALGDRALSDKEVDGFYSGHMSAEGNQVLAKELKTYLQSVVFGAHER
jgi:hypothetical protein